MSRAGIAAFALTTAALAASGCGGSSGKTQSADQTVSSAQTQSSSQGASSTEPLTRAELLAKADAICARVNARRASTKIRSTQDYMTKVPSLATYEQAAFAELGKLVPPASMASDWRQIVGDAQTFAADTAKFGEYAESSKLKAARTLFNAATTFQERMLATARRAGFTNCAQI